MANRIIVPLHGVAGALAGVAASPKHLTYGGGPLLTSVEVFTIFWGSAWTQAIQVADAAHVNQFFDSILASSLLDLLAEYSVSGKAIGHGRRIGSTTVSNSEPGGGSGRVTDAQIQQALSNWIQTGIVPRPNSNSLYFVYLPPNVLVVDPQGDQSCQTMCGYHWYIAGTNPEVYYAAMPYPCLTGCVGPLTQRDALTSISSHELCESITDPHPWTGWNDNVNGEIGDICSWQTTTVNGFAVQKEWSNSQGACVVAPIPSPLKTIFASGDMGEGAGALNWLIGDVNNDGQAEIIQLWNNNGRLGMIVYRWTGAAMAVLWGTGDIGEGSGAVSWLIGDVNKDGQAEIIQQWSNNGRLGMIVYRWTGAAMAVLWGSSDMGEGSGAISWLIGDVNKDGQAEIIQQWSNNGRLGMIVYHWNGAAMAVLWGSADMGEGSGAVSWLIGDVNKDGQAEIVQQWDNGGRLGTIVYHWTGAAMAVLWGSANLGEGSGAVSWLIGDVNKDGQAEIVQQWNNGGRLGMIIYHWTGTAMAVLWGTGDVGEGSGAVSWLIGDVNKDGRAEIVQQWNNGGRLGMIAYEYTA